MTDKLSTVSLELENFQLHWLQLSSDTFEFSCWAGWYRLVAFLTIFNEYQEVNHCTTSNSSQKWKHCLCFVAHSQLKNLRNYLLGVLNKVKDLFCEQFLQGQLSLTYINVLTIFWILILWYISENRIFVKIIDGRKF